MPSTQDSHALGHLIWRPVATVVVIMITVMTRKKEVYSTLCTKKLTSHIWKCSMKPKKGLGSLFLGLGVKDLTQTK